MANKLKHIAFIIILLALLLPALQGFFSFVPERPLHGDFEEKDMPVLTDSTWLDGSFQAAFDPWLEQHIGFHNFLVRLNNQLDYSLFHKANAEGVIRGRNGQLFEYDYIKAWLGKDFLGKELLGRKLRQFRYLQQKLKDAHDIDLVLVLEPGKASVYAEDIPQRYKRQAGSISNYEFIRDRALELGINLIDFNAWFLDMKDTVEYPLFPPQGTHWSEFAMWYAADSLISYIEEVRDIDLPDVIHEGRAYSRELRGTDYDVGVTLNLLFELQHGKMPYPQYRFYEDSTHSRPNVLAIADSYYWNIFNTHLPENLFNNQAFWYFYKKVYPDSYAGDKFISELNLREEIEKQDVILFMATERFLYKFDRGFVDDLINIYGIQYSRNRLTAYKTRIANLGSWFMQVAEKAENKGISIGEMLERDARYLLLQEDPEEYYSIFGPEPVIERIRSDDSWYAGIREKAADKGISVEEQLMEEAIYILETEYPGALRKYRRVNEVMAAIRADSSWHSYVIEKAARYYMTEEEMVRAEAEWVFEQEKE
jgi:hypothetical protein